MFQPFQDGFQIVKKVTELYVSYAYQIYMLRFSPKKGMLRRE